MQTKLEEKLVKMKEAFEKGYKGKITEVKATTNTDFFGDEGRYDTKDGVSIKVQIIDSPDDATFDQFMAIPSTLGYPKSNIGCFERKYKSYPKENIEVDIVINDEGFYKIVI